MRKGLIKIVVLLGVFVLTVAAMGLFDHQGSVDMTLEMRPATLPVVYLQQGDTRINALYGYSSEMDGMGMRDTITPLEQDLSLPVVVKTYQNQIEEVEYEVRSMDMERLVENGTVGKFSQKNGEAGFTLQFQNILEEETEYVLVLTVHYSGKQAYYYTRIARASDYFIKESLEFVKNFHEQTFDKEKSDSLATYLEPDNLGDNTTLQKVTIHSSLRQVSWADFKGERLEVPVPSIKEMGSSYNTVLLQYVLTSTGEYGEVEYYNVEEYYRVRYDQAIGRMYLLNYERTMNQIFRGENGIVDNGRLMLGIRSLDVDFTANEQGNIIAFVQEGELWSYNSGSHKLSQIYTFRNPEGVSDRENNPQHQIEIMKVDETGSMDFVVYGYMNRGKHEGETGISVFHYDSVGNTIEEELFIPFDKSYEALKAEWGKLFYVSDGNIFYLLAQDTLYQIDLYDKEAKQVMEGLKPGNYAVSEDGRYIAWQDGQDKDRTEVLKIMDLEGEETREVRSSQGAYLKPIGFVESDFVYGAARPEDVAADIAGNARFPMYKVAIVDKDSKVVKEYQKGGFYISKAYVEHDTIFLDRVVRSENGFVNAEQDTIKNQQLESSRKISIETSQSEQKQSQVQIVLGTEPGETVQKLQVVVPQELAVKESRTLKLDTGRQQENYFVYSGGRIVLSTASLTEAIVSADQHMGVVIGQEQKYVWKRGRKSVQPMIGAGTIDVSGVSGNSAARCLTYLLQAEEINIDVDDLISQGETPKQILTEALKGQKVIDLTGCSVEQVLYYVNLGTPVFAMVNTEAVLIVGYDEHNTLLYDPDLNVVRKMGRQDSNTMFEGAGNIFLGYLE
ncbi:MAG: hypothetical protein HFH42_02850 [Lachnospiraceae bacterium]|nr:hypothetical protein [Lachnospiraceae bacterium]